MSPSFWVRLSERLGYSRFLKLLWMYPPFLGAGVRIRHVSQDARCIDVEMPLTPFNRNFVGTQFGGSLYAMCDPFYMFILIRHLGPDFVVWDKSANIRFLRPGRGTVHARFEISEERIGTIRKEALTHGRAAPEFEVNVLDASNEPVARVHKVLSVKPKHPKS